MQDDGRCVGNEMKAECWPSTRRVVQDFSISRLLSFQREAHDRFDEIGTQFDSNMLSPRGSIHPLELCKLNNAAPYLLRSLAEIAADGLK
jgi:hypothetical protein